MFVQHLAGLRDEVLAARVPSDGEELPVYVHGGGGDSRHDERTQRSDGRNLVILQMEIYSNNMT